jgi:hypothetical protein
MLYDVCYAICYMLYAICYMLYAMLYAIGLLLWMSSSLLAKEVLTNISCVDGMGASKYCFPRFLLDCHHHLELFC